MLAASLREVLDLGPEIACSSRVCEASAVEEEVVVGCVLGCGLGTNLSKQAHSRSFPCRRIVGAAAEYSSNVSSPLRAFGRRVDFHAQGICTGSLKTKGCFEKGCILISRSSSESMVCDV